MSTEKKELTNTEIKKQAIFNMLESLMAGDSEKASEDLKPCVTIKTREIFFNEECSDDHDDDDKDYDKDDKDYDKDDKKKMKEKADDKDCDKDDKKKKKEKVDEQALAVAFANSGKVMSDKIMGLIKHENGGKKTLKKHDNSAPELDCDKVEDVKFKRGGKKTLKKHDNSAPELDGDKVDHFDDGRDKDLGTTKS